MPITFLRRVVIS